MNHHPNYRFKLLNLFTILYCSICFQLSCAPAPFQNYIRESDLNKKVKQENQNNQNNCFLFWSDSNFDNESSDVSHQVNVCMKLNWLNDPKSSQWLEAEIEFVQPVTGVALVPPKNWKFMPWMPSMGHGAGRPVVVEELTPSRFKISKIFFTMKGEWVIQIQIDKKVIAESKNFFVP